jgi:hypothetical protein
MIDRHEHVNKRKSSTVNTYLIFSKKVNRKRKYWFEKDA